MKFFRLLIVATVLSGCGNLPSYGELDVISRSPLPTAGSKISVTTWNVGYSAMGADADFVADGGKHLRALNTGQIAQAAREIGVRAGSFDAQFLMFQELANASVLTRNTSVQSEIERNLKDHSAVYWEDLGVAAPKPYNISHGMGIYAQAGSSATRAYELPQEPGYFFLAIKRYYAAIVTEVPIEGLDQKWVLMNVHLSAFDDGADVRRAQVRAVFDFAQAEYSKGNYVVLGGDWNMRISDKDFVHTTAEKDLFWIYDFPEDLLPKGWNFGVDERTPTVRTLHKPYVKGENYTAIIDGFAYSPNVRLRDIATMDLGFENSDHHPVSAEFSVR